MLCWRSKLPFEIGFETESASVENSTTASSSSSNVLANQACTSEVLCRLLVIQLIPGKDGHIRVARVKTETGELVRPVQRLYNLELQEPEISLPKDLTDSVIRTRRGRKVTTPKRLTYA
ncbi:hypothetical protein TNIN_354771 [Trichonephila inaurata madagascariensis]|uniref:DUF5641 domain-containing protein n=1 Tax=Trichonephila inaurata madagascariensis TaxID=2747483 RepID=A0A8X6YY31_9ARAC|nr:hypothetical protein TNIN_354771 [Trichonephila inaurata madagascariensis]